MSVFICFFPEPETLEDTTPIPWLRILPGQSILEQGIHCLSELKQHCESRDRWMVIVPGERVTLHRVSLPVRAKRAIERSLPYALEEYFCEEIEHLHIVAGEHSARGILAAAVAHRDMAAWLQPLQALDVEPRWIIPDSLLLPPGEPAQLQVLDLGERCLARAEAEEPVALSSELLDAWQQQEETRLEKALQRAPVVTKESSARSADGVPSAATVLQLLRIPPPLNLRTGRYATPGTRTLDWRPWRVAVAMTLAAVFLWISLLQLELYQLQQALAVVDQRIETVFEETLPETRSIDPVRQFQQILDRETPVATGPGPLLTRFAEMAEIVATQPVTLLQIRAEPERLELELQVQTIADLDRLRERLVRSGLGNVAILSVDTVDPGIRARLQIQERSS